MNQALNHRVLLDKCNCTRIMSINTYNKSVYNMILLHHIPYQAIVSENIQLSQMKYQERHIDVYDK
jgi:hypothetical protein